MGDAQARSQPPPDLEVFDARSTSHWVQWLEEHHETRPEGVWLRLFKQGANAVPLSYAEAVETALCFGWIDGQAKRYDDFSRVQRFTPRRRRSAWSKLNAERAERLEAAGRMRPAGTREMEAAKNDGRWQRAYDPPSTASVPDDFLRELRKHKKAAAFYATLNKRNTYAVAYRLQTAKTPETRSRRIRAMIGMFEQGEKFHE